MPKVDGLTDKQERFVEEYCVDFNATQAAIRSGYSENTAAVIGWENLRKPAIKEALAERLDALSMSAEEATKRLTDWGRGSIAPFLVADKDTGESVLDLSGDAAQANLALIRKVKQRKTTRWEGYGEEKEPVVEIFTELELHDAKDAVVQMAKIRGLYTEKHEHTGPGGTPLIIRMVDE